MSKYQLAQLNVAVMLAPIDSPVMSDFVANVDRINALAATSDGYIWRFTDPNEKALAKNVFQEQYLLTNMSVWASQSALFNFTYHSDHLAIYKRKKEWFQKMKTMHMVFWFIPEGGYPSLKEAKLRLDYLNAHGETPHAFTFKSKFTPADLEAYTPVDM